MKRAQKRKSGREVRAVLLAAAVCLAMLSVPAQTARAQTDEKIPKSLQPYPPQVPEPKAYHLPEPSVQKLSNGLTLVVVERHSLPIVTLRLVVKAGAESDPPPALGAAQMVTALLNQGTEKRSALEIAAAIDSAGGEVDTGAEWDDSYAELTVLGDHTEAAVDLLADMTRHPAFAPAELERKRRQTLSAFDVAYQDPGYLADTAFARVALEGTPYSHPQDGTAQSVRKLTREDLLAFHARYYRPGNCILAAVGDITPAAALELASKYFADWKGEAAPNANERGATADEKTRIIAIDKPDAVQTEIRVGNYGIRRNSQDYVALTVANQILGGPAANRLFNVLRTERGLTYGASSELNCYRTAGTWEAKTSTRTGETIKALKVMIEQIKLMRDRSITDPELGVAKSYLVGHQALEFESSRSVAEQVVDLMIYGLPFDDANQFPDRVRALEFSQVTSAIVRHLHPKHLVIVLVGNISAFKKDLKKLGRLEIIPASQIDFASDTLEAKPASRHE